MGGTIEVNGGRSRSDSRQPCCVAKRVLDVMLALLALPVIGPVLPLIALAVWLDSPGPALFRQERIGRNGRPFRMYKFRTMRVNTRTFALSPENDDEDARITRVGRFLRRSKLDELPQFVNVLKGEMSVVGPRPEMPFIVRQYTERQRQRLAIAPGMTGLWQISEHRFLPIHEHMEHDLAYIACWSLWLDLRIIARTLLLVFEGCRPRRMRLDRQAAVAAGSAAPGLAAADRSSARAGGDGGLVCVLADASVLPPPGDRKESPAVSRSAQRFVAADEPRRGWPGVIEHRFPAAPPSESASATPVAASSITEHNGEIAGRLVKSRDLPGATSAEDDC